MSCLTRAKHLYHRFRDSNTPETELDEEIQSYFESMIERRMSHGLSREEAQRAARLDLGGVDRVKESVREARTGASVEVIFQDVRYALRLLRKSPGFTAVAIATLSVGIGINAGVFTVTNAVLFKGFPLIERNDRILYIGSGGAGYAHFVSYPDFQDWRTQSRSFEGMGAVEATRINISDQSGFPESCEATKVSANTFSLLGQRPIIGRDFAPFDETPSATPVAILSYGLWARRYAKSEAIIGQTVRMNGAPTIVIGVMAQGFAFPRSQDLWTPLVATADTQKRDARTLTFVFGRMADGATIRSASAEMRLIGSRLASAYPLTNRGLVPTVQNFHEFFIGSNATMIYESMWGAVGFVLLIACANLANLMLARSIGRSHEISVRIALGAGRWRIIRLLLIESSMLTAVGGVFGWWIANLGIRVYELAANVPGKSLFDSGLDYAVDYRVLAYLLAISVGTGLFFGLAPAFRLLRHDINITLKDGGRGPTGGRRGKGLSSLLVIGEMALAMVLLAGAGLMVRSFLRIYAADTGVKTANILTALWVLPDTKYPNAEARISFYHRLKTRVEAIPGVESMAIADRFPTWGAPRLPYEFAGSLLSNFQGDDGRRPKIPVLIVSPAYFQALGAAVLSGRDFDDSDGISGPPVAIVNERFASSHWPGENPLGKRLRLFDGEPEDWLTVVGVVSNIVQTDFTRQEFNPLVYLPYREKPEGLMNVIVRTRVPPSSLATALRHEVQAMDSDLPMFGPFTLAERLEANYLSQGVYGGMFLVFAAIALLLASVGLYAVIAHSVKQRTPEIGIRMAMGATARDVLKLVLWQVILPLGSGLIIGLAASFAVNRVLKAELVQISPSDPITLGIASAVLILSAMLGCWIPARRAMLVDPVVALRHQ
jgi:putative ABC transport system permease protein